MTHHNFSAFLVVVLLVVSLLAACSQSSQYPPTEESEPPIGSNPPTMPTTLPTLPKTTPIPSIDATSIIEAPEEETPSATSVSPLVEIPCGIILPLVPDNLNSPIDHIPEVEIPAGLVPDSAVLALERILAAPESVGLAAYQIGQESEGIYLNADVSMPLASVVKIINLVAYAGGVAAQQLDPASWIPLSDIERFYLPRVDLGAHPRALSDLEERNLIALEPPSTPLEELPGMMIRYSSNAASDFLHLAVGQEKIERTAVDLGLTTQTAPCPWIGQDLIMTNHLQSGNNRQAVQAFVDDPAAYGQEVMRLTELFANDEAFREEEIAWHRRRPSADVWRLFGENLNAQASARDYAGLMAKIIQNDIGEPFVNILVRRTLEWPQIFPSNQELFSTIAYKDGSLPGILTTVYYAQRIEDGAQVVVALFFRDLPQNKYLQWRQDLPHDELARWILADPEAIPALRILLGMD